MYYNANNQITFIANEAPTGLPYDAAGNVLASVTDVGQTYYWYDGEGRICAVQNTPVAGTWTMTGYLYDADGTRVAKGTITNWSCDPATSGFSTTNDYILGPGGEQMTELTPGNKLLPGTGSALVWEHSNVWAGGKIIATYSQDSTGGQEIADYNGSGAGAAILLTVRGAGGLPVAGVTAAVDGATLTAVYYHHHVMGSTVAATTAGTSGAADIYTYGEFGAPGAGTRATYRYAGYRYDNETGLYYVNARYYSPNLGRFLQTDPIGLSGGANLYEYVGNDPINLFDPTGLSPQETGNDSGLGGSDALPNVASIFGNTTPNVVLGPQLSYTVTSYVAPNPNGNSGYQQASGIAWNVTTSTAGQIVQETAFTSGSGTQMPPYWEVWNVSAQGVVTPSAGTMGLNDPLGLVPSNTNDLTYAPSGTTVMQSAPFYPGLQVPTSGPGAFLPGNVPESSGLPATYTNPNLPNPSLPTTNSSLPVNRTYTAP